MKVLFAFIAPLCVAALLVAWAVAEYPGSRMTAQQAFDYVCAHTEDEAMLEACTTLALPTVVDNTSIGAKLDAGEIHGTVGQFVPSKDGFVQLDPLLKFGPDYLYNSVLIHEMVHYIDWHDSNSFVLDKAGACGTEDKAHAVQHIYLIESGHWQEYMKDVKWRTWYGC